MTPRSRAPLAVALVVLAAAAVRLRLLDVPLDRDEGEYAYFGQLLLDGVPPYAGAYNLKMPGIYGAYALALAAFGQTPAGIRAGLIVVSSATTVCLYLLGARLGGRAVGVIVAAVFAAQSLNPKLLGIAAYAEHFALLPVAASALVLFTRGRRPSHTLAAGLLLGLAVLVRQSTGVFLAGGALYLLLTGFGDTDRPWPRRLRETALLLAGAALPVILAGLALLAAGTFGTFWFWAFVYAPHYSADLATGWSNLVRTLAAVAPSSSVVLALAGVGLGVASARLPERRAFVLVLTAASIVGTTVGLQFRPHYFLLMLPALALLAGLGLGALGDLLGARRSRARGWSVPALLAVAAIAQPLYASRAVLFELTPAQVARAIYGRNPFPESVEIARYIREHSSANDRVAVVGSEPQIYFYAGRRSATGYIYTYPLMELQPYAPAMQRQMIEEIERAAPRFLVFVSATRSWVVRPGSDQTIFGWFEQYQRGFRRVGVADIPAQGETVYRWDDAAPAYAPRSDVWLMVFERGRQP